MSSYSARMKTYEYSSTPTGARYKTSGLSNGTSYSTSDYSSKLSDYKPSYTSSQSARTSNYSSTYNDKISKYTSDFTPTRSAYTSNYSNGRSTTTPTYTSYRETISPEFKTKLSLDENKEHENEKHTLSCKRHNHDREKTPCDHKNTRGYLKHRYGEDTEPEEKFSTKLSSATNGNVNGETPEERRPRSRRNRDVDDAPNEASFKSRFAREVKFNNSSVTEPGKWVGCGFQLDPVMLTADKGHLIWTEPKGKLEIVFKYGHYNQNFSLFIDPQFKGVKVYQMKSKTNMELILDGKEDPACSTNHHHITSPARNQPENNFEFKSKDGQIAILLEALRGEESPKSPFFKLNYTMAL